MLKYTNWLVSSVFLIVSNLLWAFHDTYFWDAETKAYVIEVFKDWHYLKILVIVAFFLSVWTLPRKWICLLGFLFIRWHSFTVGMHIARKDGVFPPNNDWAGMFKPFFDLFSHAGISVLLVVIWIAIVQYQIRKESCHG